MEPKDLYYIACLISAIAQLIRALRQIRRRESPMGT